MKVGIVIKISIDLLVIRLSSINIVYLEGI